MARVVVSGAQLTCSFGVAPGTLTVAPTGRVQADGMPLGTVMDHQPNVNIAPFGMCTSMSNPQVASATSAAQGVLTPQPCIPVTVSPWTPGSSTVQLGGMPVLSESCTCTCTWGGAISIANPGSTTTQCA